MLNKSIRNRRIIDKKNLQEELLKQKNILSKYIYDYLECLMELEVSFLKEGYISNEERKYLMQLELVQDIVRYNLYERAYKVFEEGSLEYPVSLSDKDQKRESLKVWGISEGEDYPIFLYQDMSNLININLYDLVESEKVREKEIKKIEERIDSLYDNQTMIARKNISIQDRIREYQTIRHELRERGPLSSEKVDTLHYYNDAIMNSLGIDILSGEKIVKGMSATLKKMYPGVKVYQNIKYY